MFLSIKLCIVYNLRCNVKIYGRCICEKAVKISAVKRRVTVFKRPVKICLIEKMNASSYIQIKETKHKCVSENVRQIMFIKLGKKP